MVNEWIHACARMTERRPEKPVVNNSQERYTLSRQGYSGSRAFSDDDWLFIKIQLSVLSSLHHYPFEFSGMQ